MDGRLLLMGGGGHCHSVLDSALSSGLFAQVGVVAKDQENYVELQKDVLVAPYLVGTDAMLPKLCEDGWRCAIVTLGSVGSTKGRRLLYEQLSKIGFEMATVVDPSAVVSRSATIGSGVYIGKRAIVNAGTVIGACSIINTGAIVEHDCVVGSFAHISPGATLCGQVRIGDDSHIGAGSAIRQQLSVGHSSLIGMGSVVVDDIPDGAKAFGNPCRVVA